MQIIEWLGHIARSLIESLGYFGVFLGMAIESCNIPLPSEVIMTFAGSLVAEGKFNFWLVVLAGALGNVVGSWVNYYLGAYGGRPFLEKYGKYMLIHHSDLKKADKWFDRYGDWAVFLTRLLPVIRTFISFPAGVSRIRIVPFTILTFAGSFLWSMLLTYVGYKLGQHYADIKKVLHGLDVVIALLLVAGAVWYVRRHLNLRKADG